MKNDDLDTEEAVELINSFENNPVAFIELFLDRNLSDKQKAFINYTKTKKHIIAIWSRQSGKSTVIASYIVWRLLYGKGAIIHGEFMPEKIAVLAPIKENLRNIYDKVRTLIDKNDLVRRFITKINTERIITITGNQVVFMSASPGAHIRGFTATCIIIDESQDVSDNKYSADIMPFGATTDALVIEAGTPKTKNHFYNTINAKNVTVVRQLWFECPFLSESYVMDQKTKIPEGLWKQEYMCEFSEEGVLAFPSKLFEPELNKDGKQTGRWNLGDYNYMKKESDLTKKMVARITAELKEGAQFAFGVDLGKQKDNTVLNIFRTDERPIILYAEITYPLSTSYMLIAKSISMFHKAFMPAEFNLDYTNEKSFVDLLREVEVNIIMNKEGKRGAITFTQKNKSEMVNTVKILLEKYQLQLPKTAETMISQFLNQQYEMTEGNKYKYYHPTNENDDSLWAALLALKNITCFTDKEITTFVNPWEKIDEKIHGIDRKSAKECIAANWKYKVHRREQITMITRHRRG